MPNASVHTEHSNATFIFLLLFSFVGDEQLKKQFQFNERMIFLSFYSLFFCFFCVFTRPRIEVVAVKCEEKWIHVDEECVDQLFTALFFFSNEISKFSFSIDTNQFILIICILIVSFAACIVCARPNRRCHRQRKMSINRITAVDNATIQQKIKTSREKEKSKEFVNLNKLQTLFGACRDRTDCSFSGFVHFSFVHSFFRYYYVYVFHRFVMKNHMLWSLWPRALSSTCLLVGKSSLRKKTRKNEWKSFFLFSLFVLFSLVSAWGNNNRKYFLMILVLRLCRRQFFSCSISFRRPFLSRTAYSFVETSIFVIDGRKLFFGCGFSGYGTSRGTQLYY